MAYSNFIKFFNSKGEDANFIEDQKLYDQTLVTSYSGNLFFPKVSVNLVESQQMYILEEVTADYREPYLRKIAGSVEVIATDPYIQGNADFSSLVAGDKVRIAGEEREVSSVGATGITVSVALNFTTSTSDFYLLDYLWYNRPMKSIDLDEEYLVGEFENETGPFFFYGIDFTEDLPVITKERGLTISILAGSTVQDPLSGRLIVDASDNNVNPFKLNFGFLSGEEGIFEENVNLYLSKAKNFSLQPGCTGSTAVPVNNGDGTWTITIPSISGYSYEFSAAHRVYLTRTIGSSSQLFELEMSSFTEYPSYVEIVAKEISSSILPTISISNLCSFGIKLVWRELLLFLSLYGEAESEDERLKLTLENFGRKLDEDKEYILRDSSIHEELTDYRLLNKKRKEMLLEGDKIFPYMGSYKALINILNLLGYYDVRIKEYFLNVDTTSLDNGKFLAVPIAKSEEQKKLVKKVWDLLPSKIYKKTSLFGLYYNLNRATEDYDEFGLPIVVEDTQFTFEEVLIKLFGLKELLKNEYLPLNARIYDITGEGVYFERYNFDTWNDQVNIRALEIGQRPIVKTYPQDQSTIRDLRRIDSYYIEKFTEQGLSRFLGDDALYPDQVVGDEGLAYLSYDGSIKDPVLTATNGDETYTISGGQVTDLKTVENRTFSTWKYDDSNNDTSTPSLPGYFKTDVSWNFGVTSLTISTYAFLGNINIGQYLPDLTSSGSISLVGATDSSIYKTFDVVSEVSGDSFREYTVVETSSNGSPTPYTDFNFSYTRDTATVDGVQLEIGDRVLIKNSPAVSGTGSTAESNQPANGIYVVTGASSSITVSRSSDADSSSEFTSKMMVFVNRENYLESYQMITTGTITPDTTPIEFEKITLEEAKARAYILPSYIPSFLNGAVSDLYGYWTGSFNDYDKGKWLYRDFSWNTMPPGIRDPQYNVKASYLKPLPDDPHVPFPTGAPVLIETIFELQWQECNFSWDQVSTLKKFTANYEANEVSGIVYVTVTDPFSTLNARGFYLGDDITISYSPFDGTYLTTGMTGSQFSFSFDGDLPYGSTHGSLSYSMDISQVSSTINRLSWDTIAQGEYIDMRVVAEKYEGSSFVYDTGRRPISEFIEPYFDQTSGLTVSRILDAVSLPYEGIYNISVYIYDITNNFTMRTEVYEAVTPIAEITAAYQEQNIYETWDSMDLRWRDASFDWYYPAQSNSKWEDANLSWESLELQSFKEQELKKNRYFLDILEINRENSSVLIQGNGHTQYEEFAGVGNFLFFERLSNTPEAENIEILPSDINVTSATEFEIAYGGTALQIWGRILVKKNTDPFYSVQQGDFFYADVVGITGSTYTLRGPDDFIAEFSNFWDVNSIFLDAGVYVGTYAIKITASQEIGANTLFYVNDEKKELYKLDGYFTPYLTNYDVDYAEEVTGIKNLNYENLNAASWETFDDKAWWAQERHSSANAGYLISRVSSGGTIQIDDNEVFQFSGDNSLNQMNRALWFFQKAALQVAASELKASNIDGIKNFDYSVYPSVPLFLTDASGNNLYSLYELPIGTTMIYLSGTPSNLTDWVWLGREWREVKNSDANWIEVDPITYSVEKSVFILIPYNYHRQIYESTDLFNQFYFFLLGISTTPSLNSLSKVTLNNGVEGEWYDHPNRTYTYPLKNTLLHEVQGFDVSMDAQYAYWDHNGRDFPVGTASVGDSRAILAGAFSEIFSYLDTVITPNSFQIKRNSAVVFSDDATKLPLKRNRFWKIVNESNGNTEVEAVSTQLLWNFQKKGKFTVSLEVSDVMGNVSRTVKKSLVTVV
jgi:hypothetical protein